MEHIDSTTQEGKERIAQLMLDAILTEDHEKFDYPYHVSKNAYANYEKLLLILADMREQGKLEFEFDDINQPYTLHCVYINWIDTEYVVEFEKSSEVANLLMLADGLVIDTQNTESNVNVWQLSTQIYFEIN